MGRRPNAAPRRRSSLLERVTTLVLWAAVLAHWRAPTPRRRPVPVAPASPPSAASPALPASPASPPWLDRADRWQQRHRPLAFVVGVVKKFGDDRAGRLAAVVAYYAFFSLFPLLLVVVTIIGYVLGEETAAQIKASAIGQIPVLGSQVGDQVRPLNGSGVALVLGLVTALWAGLGCTQAAQDAMNEVWGIPRVEQPSFLRKRLRSVGVLVVIGLALVASSAVSQVLVLLPGLDPGRRGALTIVTIAVNAVVYLLAFQILAARSLPWRRLVPGALLGSVGYTVLQLGGQWYVRRVVAGAEDTYGAFAVVIGLLGWLYLLSQWSLLAAELTVVQARRLWPRSLRRDHPTPADEEVVRAAAGLVRVRPDTTIVVHFGGEGPGPDAGTPPA